MRQSRTKSDYLAQKAQRAPIVIFDPFGKLRIRLREKSFSDPSHSPRMTALACHFAFLAFLRRSSGQAWRENNPKPEPVRKCFVESQPKILQIERERIKNGSNIHKPAQGLRYHNSLHSSCTTLSGGLTILSLIMAGIAHPTHIARDTKERK